MRYPLRPDPDYLTTAQVAATLGLTTGRVRQLARALWLGKWYGERRLFSTADVDAMREHLVMVRRARADRAKSLSRRPDPAQTP